MDEHFEYEKIGTLEANLGKFKSEFGQLRALGYLISHYSYGQPAKADRYLLQMERLLPRSERRAEFEAFALLSRGRIANIMYNYELASEKYTEGIKLLEQQGGALELARAKIEYISTLINMGEQDAAWELLDQVADVLQNFPDPTIQGYYFMRLAALYESQVEYQQAIHYYNQAEELLKVKSKDNPTRRNAYLAELYSGLAHCYKMLDDMQSSLEYAQRAVATSEKYLITGRLCWNYTTLGISYLSNNEVEKARHYLLKAIDNDLDRSEEAKIQAYLTLMYLDLQSGNPEAVLELLQSSKALFHQLTSTPNKHLAAYYHTFGKACQELGDDEQALEHFETAINYAEKGDYYEELVHLFNDYSDLMALRGDYKTAYTYRLYKEEAKSEFNRERSERKIKQIQRRNEIQRRRRHLDFLRLQNNELQLQLLRSQMNPHFLSNAMTGIQALINTGRTDEAVLNLSELGELMRIMLSSAYDAYISIEEEKEFLEHYLQVKKSLLLRNHFNYRLSIDEDIEEDIMGVPSMLLQPFVENAIEHGIDNLRYLNIQRDGLIRVAFKLINDEELMVIIEDNGVGLSQARRIQTQKQVKKKGRGVSTGLSKKRLEVLTQMTGRLHAMSAKEIFDDETGAVMGTRVEIILPVYDLPIKTKF